MKRLISIFWKKQLLREHRREAERKRQYRSGRTQALGSRGGTASARKRKRVEKLNASARKRKRVEKLNASARKRKRVEKLNASA